MTTPLPNHRPQQRLFQNNLLHAIWGPDIANMVTRMVIILAAIGTLAIITAGLLNPNTPVTSLNTHTAASSHVPVVGLVVGNAAPNFTLSTLDGKKVSLSDYRGRPVMLNFWYATCPGCLAEIPGMQRYYAAQQAAGKDFVILGVNVLDDSPTASQFVHQHGLTYPVLLDQGMRVEELYNVNGTPTSFFLDRSGIIRSTVVGPVDDTTLKQNVAQIST